ncbi:reverse transcriptase domain-containing protein, partial [Tanacetum coccineum]
SKTMTDAQAHYTTTEKELLAVILLLQELDVIIRDKKGAENLAADLLSRLENPYQDVLENKEITETFPLETLGMVTFRGDSSNPWFTDIANYHAGNFIVKGMSSQQKKNSLKMLSITFGTTPTCLELGINFMGPFPSSRGNKYILVVVDYLSKWVKAKVLPTNDARVVVKFFKSLFARFGTPRAIINDRGTHFCNDQFAKVMLKCCDVKVFMGDSDVDCVYEDQNVKSKEEGESGQIIKYVSGEKKCVYERQDSIVDDSIVDIGEIVWE